MLTFINDEKKININVICTQVSGEGVSVTEYNKKLFSKYPKAYIHYRQLCKSFDFDYLKLRGNYQFIRIDSSLQICNLFIQKPDLQLDFNAMKKAFKDVFEISLKNNLTLAIPEYFGYEDNIDKWDDIKEFLEQISIKYSTNIYIIKLKNIEIEKEKKMEDNEVLNKETKNENKELKEKPNSLDKLNDILFNQIEKLSKASDGSEVQQEISKSYAISHMSQRIINNANVYLKAIELSDKKGIKDSEIPEVLRIDNE